MEVVGFVMVNKKDKHVIYMASVGAKIFATVFWLVFGVGLSILLFFGQPDWTYIVAVCLINAASLLGLYVVYSFRLVLNKKTKTMTIHSITITKIEVADILEIVIIPSKVMFNNTVATIEFRLKNGRVHKASGYNSIADEDNLEMTNKQVEELKEQIRLLRAETENKDT